MIKNFSANLKQRNLGLDFLMAIAILVVLISHERTFLPKFTYKDYLSVFGFLDVKLFFVLSGFLLVGILFKEFDFKNYTLNTLKQFFIRRWFRIFQLYFIFLLINIFLLQYFFDKKEWDWTYVFFLQNFTTPYPYMMSEAWSISMEEWFYIYLHLLLFILLIFFKDKKNNFLSLTSLYVLVFAFLKIYFVFEANLNRVYRVCNSISTTLDSFFSKAFIFSMTSSGFALIILKAVQFNIKNIYLVNVITKIPLYSYSVYLLHLSVIIPLFKSFELHKELPVFIFHHIYIYTFKSYL